MIVGRFNIRGGGSLVKQKRIRSLISQGRANFFIIQETKLQDVSDSIAMSLGGSDDMD